MHLFRQDHFQGDRTLHPGAINIRRLSPSRSERLETWGKDGEKEGRKGEKEGRMGERREGWGREGKEGGKGRMKGWKKGRGTTTRGEGGLGRSKGHNKLFSHILRLYTSLTLYFTSSKLL